MITHFDLRLPPFRSFVRKGCKWAKNIWHLRSRRSCRAGAINTKYNQIHDSQTMIQPNKTHRSTKMIPPKYNQTQPQMIFLFFFFILDWDLAWPRWLGWNTPNTTNTTSYCNQKPNKTLISKNIRHLRLCRSSTAGAINILQLVNNTNLQLICAQIVCCILTKGELRHHMWRINHLINHYIFSWVFSTVNPKTAYSEKLKLVPNHITSA